MEENVNYQSQKPEEKPAGKLKGKAEIKKKKPGQKIVDFLFSNKIDDMGAFLMNTIIKPGILGILYNTVVGAAGAMFRQNGGYYQQSSQGGYQPPWVPQQTNYNSISSQAAWGQQRPVMVAQSPYANDYKSVIFTYRDDALTVIDRLANQINRYGRASVREFYNAAEVTPPLGNWAIDGIGWHTVMGAHPIPTGDGRWIIEMPPVQNL